MSTAAGTTSSEKLKIFETVLSSPGMNEKCKMNLQVSRLSILLLSHLMEVGWLGEKGKVREEWWAVLPQDAINEIKAIQEELLQKGNLTAFYERLKLL